MRDNIYLYLFLTKKQIERQINPQNINNCKNASKILFFKFCCKIVFEPCSAD